MTFVCFKALWLRHSPGTQTSDSCFYCNKTECFEAHLSFFLFISCSQKSPTLPHSQKMFPGASLLGQVAEYKNMSFLRL